MTTLDRTLMRTTAIVVAAFFLLQIVDRLSGSAWERGFEMGKKSAELETETKALQAKIAADKD